MTEVNQVWHVFRRYIAPFGHLQRIESIGQGIPDLHYSIMGVSGWVEFKLGQREGIRPASLTLDQVLWAEAYAAPPSSGRVFLLVRIGSAWLLYDAASVRALYDGLTPEPLVRVRGRFPLRELLAILAPPSLRGGLIRES